MFLPCCAADNMMCNSNEISLSWTVKNQAKGNHVSNHALFGAPAINANSLKNKKVVHSVPADGCKAFKGGKAKYAGKVVLIKRGTCYFTLKVRQASLKLALLDTSRTWSYE